MTNGLCLVVQGYMEAINFEGKGKGKFGQKRER
jgi:hypothetical protein